MKTPNYIEMDLLLLDLNKLKAGDKVLISFGEKRKRKTVFLVKNKIKVTDHDGYGMYILQLKKRIIRR